MSSIHRILLVDFNSLSFLVKDFLIEFYCFLRSIYFFDVACLPPISSNDFIEITASSIANTFFAVRIPEAEGGGRSRNNPQEWCELLEM